MANEDDNTNEKKSWYAPANLLDGFSRLFSEDAEIEKGNDRAQLGWMLAAGYVLGNSIGTNNTKKVYDITEKTLKNDKVKRIGIGPVYIW